jgi:hypothetical protein
MAGGEDAMPETGETDVTTGLAGAGENTRQRRRWTRALLVLLVLVGGFFVWRACWPRGEALVTALQPMIEGKDADQSLVAQAIRDNYGETRKNASRWSGIYWGFTFVAAALSALAGLILKLESLASSEKLKKDLAATFSVVAAMLITISTSGDFQRKWQANRVAAAELERTGYELLENKGADARGYLKQVGEILLRRHLAIVGGSATRDRPEGEGPKPSGKPEVGGSPKKGEEPKPGKKTEGAAPPAATSDTNATSATSE